MGNQRIRNKTIMREENQKNLISKSKPYGEVGKNSNANF